MLVAKGGKIGCCFDVHWASESSHPSSLRTWQRGVSVMLQVEFRGLGSGGFSSSGSGGFTSSTAFPPRSATDSPTPSARSGNPFQEFYEQGGAQEAGDKTTAASGQSTGIQNRPSQGSMGGEPPVCDFSPEHSSLCKQVGEST